MPILEEPRYLTRPGSAAQALRDAIISGELKSGERLVELQLASRFRIGQPTVREALKELEYQGFVHKLSNRGTYVTDFSTADFRKIHEARMALEPLAFERAAGNMTPEAATDLAATVRGMAEAAAGNDRAAFHSYDLEFHRKVWRLAGNQYIEMALERFLFAVFAFVLSRQHKTEFLSAVKQHRKYLAGLVSGDPGKARRAFVEGTADFWGTYYRL
ncbi:MAG: Transcriptional regulator, GntR family [Acidobacteria bacterium]|nr:Transcriptional regulator, GntR family [Acidobacteriota bacterium]